MKLPVEPLQTRRTFTQLRKFKNWSRSQARKLRCRYCFFLISGILPSPCCFILPYSIYTFFQLEQELQSDVGTPQTEDEQPTGMDISDQRLSSSSVQVFSGTHLQPS